MRRMITEKELSFFDSYAQIGAIGKYANLDIFTNQFDEYPGIKNIDSYMRGSKLVNTGYTAQDVIVDFHNAEIDTATYAFANISTEGKITLKNAKFNQTYALFYNSAFTEIDFENVIFRKKAVVAFHGCSNLVRIGAVDISEITEEYALYGIFQKCTKLKKIEMKHFRTDFDISESTAFTTDSLVEIISNLDDTGSAHTLTMGATNLAKLSEAQKKVATDKGWNLA